MITTLAWSTRSNSAVNGIVAALLPIVLILSLSNPVWGVDPGTHISQYRHSAWRVKDGLALALRPREGFRYSLGIGTLATT
jgi:hypothetical protein